MNSNKSCSSCVHLVTWRFETPKCRVLCLAFGERELVGAEVDTLVHVVRGEGVLTTEDGEEPLRAGDVALLPHRTVRGFRAGEDGLEYLTVHRRRRSLTIQGPRD